MVDGCPPNKEIIPFCIPLRGIVEITPTLKNVLNKFSTKYFIKCIVQEEDAEESQTILRIESSMYEIHLSK